MKEGSLEDSVVDGASGRMYSRNNKHTMSAAQKMLNQHGCLKVHAEPVGTVPPDGAIITVTKTSELESAIDESFVNAAGFCVGRQRPHIWFSH